MCQIVERYSGIQSTKLVKLIKTVYLTVLTVSAICNYIIREGLMMTWGLDTCLVLLGVAPVRPFSLD